MISLITAGENIVSKTINKSEIDFTIRCGTHGEAWLLIVLPINDWSQVTFFCYLNGSKIWRENSQLYLFQGWTCIQSQQVLSWNRLVNWDESYAIVH